MLCLFALQRNDTGGVKFVILQRSFEEEYPLELVVWAS